MEKAKLTVFAGLTALGVLAADAVASPNTSTISLRQTAVGKVLVAADGRTLYLFTADNGARSACSGQCAVYWPPLIATDPSVSSGLKSSMLGTTKRHDGKLQGTYDGHPLYYFALDKKAGEVKGQGIVHFGGGWWVVSAVGAKITSKP